MAELWNDQADGLRRLLSVVPLQFVALTSAHAEPGRPWAVLNLAAALRLAGVGVLVIDGAAGYPGGLTAPLHGGHELADVLAGRCQLEAAILPGPEGIPVLPARTGIAGLAEDDAPARRLSERLHALPGGIEVLLVNLPADEGGGQVSAALLAHELVVTASPDRDSVTSTYRLLKRLALSSGKREFRLLVTGAASAAEARRVHRTLAQALERWVDVRLDLLGVMPADPDLRLAASQGRTLVTAQPSAATASNFRRMADSLIRWRSHANARSRAEAPVFTWADAVGLAIPSMRG
jgi:flagellar biosynthesis protein FlhG